ncbi:PREDICTED: uncharacterized protein LOC104748415 [Camelina sativa]|uniref:Uncharacterized protein LOC104748415 n=1 Tax=Camelina sativa TaxID=90675 RepID=A0ABM1QZR8_CAMSA|nr:PREDICTED: uncharacterized protein LOC104748415 [Camelina sativa]
MMHSGNELMLLQKAVILDDRGYGRWKVRTVQLIRNLGEDAWTAVEEGWEPPYEKTKAGDKITKPKARWTVDEKNLSKYNARTLNVIFGAVDDDEFKLVQGCESAKDAWDILQKSHEGNSSVKITRLDQLASQSEVLRMDPDETISQFSAKMSAIANEAKNLGKIYKNTKLVKKLIRCLPSKYAAHKAVIRVSGTAFKADDTSDQLKEIKDNMSLMARNFGKALKRVEKGQERESSSWNRNNAESPSNCFNRTEKEKADHRKDVQCHECNGFGHYKPECLLTKRKEMKCFECKGFGHLKTECSNLQKAKNKSFISFSDSDFYSDEEEGMLNLFAFSAKSDEVPAESSYDDEEDSITKESYCLEAKVNMLEEECKSEVTTCKELLPAEKELLERKLRNLQEFYGLEKERSTSLERELNENHKKIRMLNNGGKKLDEILSMGIVGSQHRGLGYNKQHDVELLSRDKSISFVKSNVTHAVESTVLNKVNYRGSAGHVRRFCYKFKNKIKELWMARKCFIDPFHFCKVWVAKKALYNKNFENDEKKYDQGCRESEEINLCCNLSKIVTEYDVGVEPQVLQKHVAEPSIQEKGTTESTRSNSNDWNDESSGVLATSKQLQGHKNQSAALAFVEQTVRHVQLNSQGVLQHCFVSQVEPKNIIKALEDYFWYKT